MSNAVFYPHVACKNTKPRMTREVKIRPDATTVLRLPMDLHEMCLAYMGPATIWFAKKLAPRLAVRFPPRWDDDFYLAFAAQGSHHALRFSSRFVATNDPDFFRDAAECAIGTGKAYLVAIGGGWPPDPDDNARRPKIFEGGADEEGQEKSLEVVLRRAPTFQQWRLKYILLQAARRGRPRCMSLLIDCYRKRANPHDVQMLYSAIDGGSPQCVRLAMTQGKKGMITDAEVQRAARLGNTDMVRYLLAYLRGHADTHAALTQAARSGHDELLPILEGPLSRRHDRFDTLKLALIWAIAGGHDKCVAVLVGRVRPPETAEIRELGHRATAEEWARLVAYRPALLTGAQAEQG